MRDSGRPARRYGAEVQFSRDLRERVAKGEITLSVRLWQRPQVREGGRYRTAGTVIEIDSIELLPFSALTAADVRRTGDADHEALRLRAAHAGPVHDDTLVYRIEFHVADSDVQDESSG